MPGGLEGLLAHGTGTKADPSGFAKGANRFGYDTEDGRQDAVEKPQGSEDSALRYRAPCVTGLGNDRPRQDDRPGQPEMAVPLETGGSLFCGVVAAHAVDAGTWGR
jgi:hypothetical protein